MKRPGEKKLIFIALSLWAPLVAQMVESAHNVRDLDLILRLGRFRREGNDNLLQYSCLVNPMDWQPTVPSVTKIRTRLSE